MLTSEPTLKQVNKTPTDTEHSVPPEGQHRRTFPAGSRLHRADEGRAVQGPPQRTPQPVAGHRPHVRIIEPRVRMIEDFQGQRVEKDFRQI